MMEEKIEAPPIGMTDSSDKAADIAFHPGLVVFTAFSQDPRAHHRRKGDRQHPRSKNDADNIDRNSRDYSADQPGDHLPRRKNALARPAPHPLVNHTLTLLPNRPHAPLMSP